MKEIVQAQKELIRAGALCRRISADFSWKSCEKVF